MGQIELLAAAQGIEFHAPLQTSNRLQRVVGDLRLHVANYDRDRFFKPDMLAAQGIERPPRRSSPAAKEIITSGPGRDDSSHILPSL